MADVNLVPIIMHSRDQSNLVAADVKDREFSNLIGLRKDFAQLCEIQQARSSHNFIPTRES